MERLAVIIPIATIFIITFALVGCGHTVVLKPEFPKAPEVLMKDEYSLKTIQQYRSEKNNLDKGN